MILITGATGIVGSHILADLLAQNKRVRAMVRSESNRQAIEQLIRFRKLDTTNLFYVIGDVLDPASIQEAMLGCTEVYHCAARVSFRPKDKNMLFETNVHGTANVVDACLNEGIERLCYISSTTALGDQTIEGKLKEESIWVSDKGRSGYSISKRYSELEVWRGKQEGLNAVIVNPGIVIGAGNWGESSTSIILTCENGMRFFPSESNGFVAATDVAKFCIESMATGRFDQRYVLIGENVSYKRLFSSITGEFGSPAPKFALSKMIAEPARMVLRALDLIGINPFTMTSENLDSAYRKVVYNNERAKKTGFSFRLIDDAIKETIAIYRSEKKSISLAQGPL